MSVNFVIEYLLDENNAKNKDRHFHTFHCIVYKVSYYGNKNKSSADHWLTIDFLCLQIDIKMRKFVSMSKSLHTRFMSSFKFNLNVGMYEICFDCCGE